MRKLTDFVKQHMKIPAGEDEAFIVRFERSPKNIKRDKFFRFFISTKRLLRNIANSTVVQLDATHKVTTEKVPIIAAGTTDKNSNFHFAGMTIANHEKGDDYQVTLEGIKKGVEVIANVEFKPTVLICDVDTGIHSAFKSVFGVNDGNFLTIYF